jgi:hypothetical protein
MQAVKIGGFEVFQHLRFLGAFGSFGYRYRQGLFLSLRSSFPESSYPGLAPFAPLITLAHRWTLPVESSDHDGIHQLRLYTFILFSFNASH